jgi:O-acetyl-ADP-ribose deacetylase (regulator of RNase III)
MINTIKGNVLDIKYGIIVHSCNDMSVMGSGVALEIKNRFPEVYDSYKALCLKYYINAMGKTSFVEVDQHKIIVNGIGQHGYGRDGKRYVDYEAITKIFEQVNEYAIDYYIKHHIFLPICFPLIGCGFGGGKWEIISSIIDTTVSDRFEKNLYIL